MKLLFGYTLDYLRRNWRGSVAIMVAILMTATMLSALCGFLYNIYADNLRYILRETGDWHGELFDDTPGSALGTIESFDSVASILIKGNWNVAQIDDPRRDYLVWRDANEAYWNSMPEGDLAILSGRPPAKRGEIALSKQYFEHHPELKLGDTITLPVGNRVAADRGRIPPQSVIQPGEQFEQTGTVTLTVVGELDFATSSTVPAYTALGYLDPTEIRPDDDLTVYLRFHNIRETYRELPKIAQAVGYAKDEYGNYLLRYNTDYLVRRAVLSPEQTGLVPKLLANQMPLTFGVIGLLVAVLFVLIIHNAFVLSSTARLSQLGIFASVGATPKQIKQSVVLEGLLLTAIPLPVGLVLGQGCVALYVQYANQWNTQVEWGMMSFVVGWQSLLPAILLTVLTVWWSALIPARKIGKMAPIDAIRQGGTEKLKKPKRFTLNYWGKCFGLPGELAANALGARRKSYRTATLSLTLSFLTLATFLCINSASTASKEVYQTDIAMWAEQDILLTLYNVAAPEDYVTATGQVEAAEGIDSVCWYSTLRTAVWMPETEFSAAFQEKGGFPAVEEYLSDTQVPLLRDGARRVNVTLLGMDDRNFDAYCATLGLDPAPFYAEDTWRGILYHTVSDVVTGTRRTPVLIPFFDLEAGDRMTLTETTLDSYEGDFSFDMEILAVADQMPPIGSATFNRRYSAIQVLPMSRIRELATHFTRSNIVRVDGVIQVSDPGKILSARAEIDGICDRYFGSGDYRLLDEVEYFTNEEAGQSTVILMFGFVTCLLAVIGLSNAWSTVRGTLNARRREFAMLRSVGLPPQGLRQMLALEALMLGLTPILLSLPVILILQGVFLSINEVTLMEWLPFAPVLPLLAYVGAVLAVIMTADALGGRKLLNENIIESIKIDAI